MRKLMDGARGCWSGRKDLVNVCKYKKKWNYLVKRLLNLSALPDKRAGETCRNWGVYILRSQSVSAQLSEVYCNNHMTVLL